MDFRLWWFIALIVLLVAAGAVGKSTKGTYLGLLIDDRDRYSLNHFQIVMWTLLILATFLAAFVSSGFAPASLQIPNELLILMGISVGSAVTSGAIKSNKDTEPEARIAMRGAVKLSDGQERKIQPRLRQVILEEEGDRADEVVNVTKFQNYVFSVVAGVSFVVLALKALTYPALSEQVLWLIGISQGGYLGGKLPNRQ